MKRSILFQAVAACLPAIALAAHSASAQDANTLSISGTFTTGEYGELYGTVGDDLAEVYAAGDANSWTLTLYGVAYTYDSRYKQSKDGYDQEFITRVHATSFDFEFFGPDAGVLNMVVSQQLAGGGLTNGAFLEFVNGEHYDSVFPFTYASWALKLQPNGDGVTFGAESADYDEAFSSFPADENGYPLVPQGVLGLQWIEDLRSGNDGALVSYGLVDIGSSTQEPPILPGLSIEDASVREGDRGRTWLDLTVTLSDYPANTVTVDYETVDGTARDGRDYYGTSGTLFFGPDEISRTISIEIKGDRKREADETFYVDLFNAARAIIADGAATATILNDD